MLGATSIMLGLSSTEKIFSTQRYTALTKILL